VKRAKTEVAWLLGAALLLAAPARALAAGPDPAADAQRLIAKLDVPATQKLAADPLVKAKAAQKRAQSARGAGDLTHAAELDTLALLWAQVADDLVRASESEKQLADVQKKALEMEQKALRTQALIEQTIARRGRAEQNLSALEISAPPAAKAGSKNSTKPATETAAKPAAKPATDKPAPGGVKPVKTAKPAKSEDKK